MVQANTTTVLFVLFAPLVAVVAHNLWRLYRDEHNVEFLNAVGISGSIVAYYLSGDPLHIIAYYCLFMGMVFAQGRTRESNEDSMDVNVDEVDVTVENEN